MRKEVIKNVVKINLEKLIKEKIYIIWFIWLCFGGISDFMELSNFIICGYGLIIFQDSLEKFNLYKIVPLQKEEVLIAEIITKLIIIFIGSCIHMGSCIFFKKYNFMRDTISLIIILILCSTGIQIGKYIKEKYYKVGRNIVMLVFLAGYIVNIERSLEMNRKFIDTVLIVVIAVFIGIIILFREKIKKIIGQKRIVIKK